MKNKKTIHTINYVLILGEIFNEKIKTDIFFKSMKRNNLFAVRPIFIKRKKLKTYVQGATLKNKKLYQKLLKQQHRSIGRKGLKNKSLLRVLIEIKEVGIAFYVTRLNQ